MSSCGKCDKVDDLPMVACDECGKWFHFTCVGVDSTVESRDWSCEECSRESNATPKSSGIRPQPEVVKLRNEQFGLQMAMKREPTRPPHRVINAPEITEPAAFEMIKAGSGERSPPYPTDAAPKESMNSTEFINELKFLEERQAMERRHLQERSQLQTRHGVFEETQASGSRPQAYGGLNQNQISARQVVGKELPHFHGNPEEWPLFIASYESSTKICGYTEEENLLRLQRSLKGKALEAVRCRLMHPRNLAGAISTLRTLFGRPECIIHSLIAKIREMPNPRADKLNTLIDYGIAVQNVCATIECTGLSGYLYNVALLQELTDKLPPTIRLNWAYHKQTLQDVTMLDFGDWLNKLVEAASSVTMPGTAPDTAPHRKPHDNKAAKKESFVHAHNAEAVPRKESQCCCVCQGKCSSLEKCERFLAENVDGRWTLLRTHRMCRKCLKKHNGACQRKEQCGENGCTFLHHRLLHNDKSANNVQLSGEAVCGTHSMANNQAVLFRYVPVTLFGNGKSINTYAFLDDGSSSTFVERSLVEELGLRGTPDPLCLRWTGDQTREESDSVRVSLQISGTHSGGRKYRLAKVHTVQSLSLPLKTLSVQNLEKTYPHLAGLPLHSYEDIAPKLLIGIDNCHLGTAMRCVKGKMNEPVAAKTRLGWVAYGPCITSPDTAEKPIHSFHICTCSDDNDKKTDRALQQYFSTESLGIYKNPVNPVSKNEERALNILSTVTNLKGNRYESGLLWRFDEIRLPDSRTMALRRFKCLEKRMNRDPVLAAAVKEKMDHFISKGYIRQLSQNEQNDRLPRDWYLPIFSVTNPNKPGSFRLVMDAAAKVNGVSLNSFLLTGPDQLTSLLAVLLKFREFKYAIVGDIREMFFQVLMRPQDQRSQMILWNGGNSNKDPDTYVVTVMTFGAACSPSTAHFVKNLNADRFSQNLPRAVQCIKYEHYVDDMLSSVETENEAIKLAQDVRHIHAQARFEIRNWQSNSSKVAAELNGCNVSDKHLDLDAEASSKVLGMWWNTTSDTFTFRLSPKHDADLLLGSRMPTKREVLRTLMAIYDPLGLIGHFLMYPKVLLQDVWRSGIGWDEEIPDKLADKWRSWIAVLPDVRQVSVPRCYRVAVSVAASAELHVFCDASEKGIAAVAYLRFQENETVECAMVGSKTKVAPLKFLSIPRLELQAAVVGTRLANSILQSLSIKISRRVFWTDSRDVVCWLRSDHRRYSTFVAFRVSEILESSIESDWRWVPTKLNVADDGTKWQSSPNFDPNARWFSGPEFLQKPESDWPGGDCVPDTTTEEIRESILHHTIVNPLIRFERFSKWCRLLRAVAYIHRYIANLRKRANGESAEVGSLTQEELSRGENTIYKLVQQQVYNAEVQILRKDQSRESTKKSWERTLPKSSALYELNPTIIQETVGPGVGLWRRCVPVTARCGG